MTVTTKQVYDCRIGEVLYGCRMTVFPNAKKGEQRWELSRSDIAAMIIKARNNGATNDEILAWMIRSRLVPKKSATHKETTTMTNRELMASMQAPGRMIVGHVGDSAPKGTIVYSLPVKRPVLKSRRFAMVIGNELHVRKYEDPAHGWLAVPVQWIEALGIVWKISSCSYLKGGTAYLEEDCDAPEFRKAAEKHGFRLFVDYRHTNDRSAIRSYPSFN